MDHLKQVNMTYIQHAKHAATMAGLCLLAGFVLLIHAILPILLTNTGSSIINKIIAKMQPKDK